MTRTKAFSASATLRFAAVSSAAAVVFCLLSAVTAFPTPDKASLATAAPIPMSTKPAPSATAAGAAESSAPPRATTPPARAATLPSSSEIAVPTAIPAACKLYSAFPCCSIFFAKSEPIPSLDIFRVKFVPNAFPAFVPTREATPSSFCRSLRTEDSNPVVIGLITINASPTTATVSPPSF